MSTTPQDLSHACLIAILMQNGGSYDLPDGIEADALGGRDGAFHAVRMDRLTGGGVRLSVVARPDGDAGGMTAL